MRPANYLPKPSLLLPSLAAISFFGAPAFAQDNKDEASAAAEPTSADDSKDADKTSAAAAEETNADDAKTDENKDEDSKTEEASKTEDNRSDEKEESTSEAPKSTEAKTTAKPEPTTSGEEDDESTSISQSVDSKIPRISSSEVFETDMPTLTGPAVIPTYPAPTIPPTKNAPFMQHSNAPDGTVFIAVGAILGALGIAILLWRVIVGVLLHRSVEKAARAQQHDISTTKTVFPAPPAPFYKYTDNASTMSLSAGRGVRRTNRGPAISSTPSQSNLFFSPTAAASGQPGNRGSAFLPSGFYAAGNSSTGGIPEQSISMTNLRPDSRGFGNNSRHNLDRTPPESPGFIGRRDISNSSVNLTRPPSQRAPSAFLDDLLADDPNAFPPPQMPASAGDRRSSRGSPGPQNRF